MPFLKNSKHEVFAQAVAKGEYIDQAYVTAGYVPNKGNADSLYAKDHIKVRIADIQRRGAERAEISIAMVLNELKKLAFSSMRNYTKKGQDGVPYVDMTDTSDYEMGAIQEITTETRMERVKDSSTGRVTEVPVKKVKFRLYDKRAALVDIGKHLQMFSDKLVIEQKPLVDPNKSSAEIRAEMLAWMESRGLIQMDEDIPIKPELKLIEGIANKTQEPDPS